MIRPRKMKFIELTVFKNDMDRVLEYLGKQSAIQFLEEDGTGDNASVTRIRQVIGRLTDAAVFLGVELPSETSETFSVPGSAETALAEKICSVVDNLKERITKLEQEKNQIRDTFNEVQAFSKMNMPFSELEQLSYLTLRLGRLDVKNHSALREELGDRAVIIPIGEGNRVLAASSKKGRFALDSSLKKFSFEPIAVPKDNMGVPAEMLVSLEEQRRKLEEKIEVINVEKEQIRKSEELNIKQLVFLWNTALIIEVIKSKFTATESFYHFSGWIPADIALETARGLLEITGGRAAIRTYSPEEIPSVKDGSEKVPVSMKHGTFVKGFEGVVFSYGAPLYGTIDPTPLVAIFFTILFGLMFGDIGQGLVLLIIGFLTSAKGPKVFSKFKSYSVPLVSVGIASMVMGVLTGSIFTREDLLIAPTRFITTVITGNPVDRFLHIMPMASEGGSLQKMLFFFGFTVGIGVILNSAGLLINIINRCILKKYEAAFFSKTGLAGLLMFWYALFIALRVIFGGRFKWFDFLGLLIPVFCIFFGPVIWRIISREKPVLEHGLMTFIMEGFVEVLETVSTYISNTVSFLRVGAFALSHAVLSFIVFRFSEALANSGIAGSAMAVLIMILGNIIIIVLEGMIVAIQVVRLQYYEFFNKFFVETGVEFAPFRFKK
ncbi:MAG: V-type ATP synthase subunit I [Treponema sp.]|jgi:V/A-type H+-transporting ATPase subunit I|nr:V-type ATP synthase subunit I [Treponema sp.]